MAADTHDEAKSEVPDTADPASHHAGATLAIASLVLVVFLAVLVLVPAARNVWPWPLPILENTALDIDLSPVDEKLVAQSRRVDILQEMVTGLEGRTVAAEEAARTAAAVPAVPETVNTRLTVLEDQAAAQQQQTATASNAMLALILLRLEQQMQRGQSFAGSLALLEQKLPQFVTTDDNAVLVAAARGVTPIDKLQAQLGDNERRIRRVFRLAQATNPLERMWAELQSLVMIKKTGDVADDAAGVTLWALDNALTASDTAAFAAAWERLPAAVRDDMAAWYNAAQERMAVGTIVDRLLTQALNEAGTGG